MELALETELSRKPVLQASDATALTREQQEALNLHKVRLFTGDCDRVRL